MSPTDNNVRLESDEWQGPQGVQVFDQDTPGEEPVVEHPTLGALRAKMMRKLGSMLEASDPSHVQSAMQVLMQLRQEEEYRVHREQQQKAAEEYMQLARDGKLPQGSVTVGGGIPMVTTSLPYQGQQQTGLMSGNVGTAGEQQVAETEATDAPKTAKRSSSRTK